MWRQLSLIVQFVVQVGAKENSLDVVFLRQFAVFLRSRRNSALEVEEEQRTGVENTGEQIEKPSSTFMWPRPGTLCFCAPKERSVM